MSKAQVGGLFGCLAAKEKKKKPAAEKKDAKPAPGKVLSLKDSNPQVPKAAPAKAEPTKAEAKKEREKKDHHETRSGAHGPSGAPSKGDGSVSRDQAAKDKAAADAAAAKRAEQRQKQEDEEKQQKEAALRQMTYEEYLEKQKGAKPVVAKTKAREVDDKALGKLGTKLGKKKEEEADVGLTFKVKKEAPQSPPAKKAAPKQAAKPAGKAAKGKKAAEPEPAQPPAKHKAKYQDLTKELVCVRVERQRPPPSAPRTNAAFERETAYDVDGTQLTKQQFVDKYKGFAEWDKASAEARQQQRKVAAVAAQAAADEPAAEPEPEADTW
eukprot:TRINITY_DN5615_c4_g2_i1.p2 TRINITY_DN5615_c4_g2~~TRINITY_DN5615_c4_g2_i1.p2  ORF type:complete len:351 (+),score=176.78 TRINITY_DN5615_c4_g2_i1:81-1055(+)